MEDGKYVDGSIWLYAPNKGAPVFFAVAFLATAIAHAWQATHYHSWKLTGLYVICGVLFVLGFVFREIGAFDYKNVATYIISVCFCYAAPPLYELGNYHILGRILYFVPYYSPIHPGRVLSTFAGLSVIIETLNGIGSSMSANRTSSESTQQTGKALLQAALILQLVLVTSFVVLAGFFQWKCRKNGINHPKVNRPLFTLYISSAIILVRCIYRAVEFFDFVGIDFDAPDFDYASLSPILRYEWFFYVFEATLMLGNSALLNFRHPGRWLPQSTKIYLAKDGVSEVTGPGYSDDRNVLVTLFDPFDIGGMVRGKDKTSRFWDQEQSGEGPSDSA
ncbi:RTA1 like protein-domain-containing protein [Xylariomycetidae sp. FL0641]|nr:RTA1 like protein-domain-containing protein [Xylariomycetidae sp. FL0641]